MRTVALVLGGAAMSMVVMSGCGGSDDPADAGPLKMSYSAAESGENWPWRVESLTVVCSDLDGGAHATTGGVTYGLTGRDSLNNTARGYSEYKELMTNPDEYQMAEPFLQQVEDDCKRGFARRGEDVY